MLWCELQYRGDRRNDSPVYRRDPRLLIQVDGRDGHDCQESAPIASWDSQSREYSNPL